YFQYDSKKSGGVTISHLRFGDKPIKSTYYVKQADFVACHAPAYLKKYDMVQDVKPGGFFLLNCPWSDDELEAHLPGQVKRYIAENDIQFYTCDAVSVAKRVGLGARRTNSVLQAAFFKLADIIPIDEAVGYMKEAIVKTYSKKGQNIVDMNIAAIDGGLEGVHKIDVPASWKDCEDDPAPERLVGRDEAQTAYVNDILVPTNTLRGDAVPVSTFLSTANGMIPSGTAAFEKRGIAADVPVWTAKNCMQCNWCSYVCPHGVIRPFVLEKEEAEASNEESVPMKGMPGKYFAIRMSAMDCTGCGSCADTCQARNKALEMVEAGDITEAHQAEYDVAFKAATGRETPFKEDTVKGSQFLQPLMEFSGACPGCGESPYAKLITQLFGDRMYIANATGCSSIWGCSAPSTPYTTNAEGRGPAWANSLFEDNAEFGLGMATSIRARRNEMRTAVDKLAQVTKNPELKVKANAWLATMDDAKLAEKTGKALLEACEAEASEEAKYVVDNQDMLIKPSMWIFGGDGWAYDIGYGGLDHVLASGENVNVCVFDTEVYSNTGGQSSKATPIGAVAKFAASGKAVKKKDLAQIAISYGYIYVATVAMGANPEQTLKAFREAEAYDGPSLIICYAPCINHGVKAGMNKAMLEMKKAVRAGYWNLLRYNPALEAEGKNPLSVDSHQPTDSYNDFIMGEVRYNSLKLKFPERAEELFNKAEEVAVERYDKLVQQKKNLDK
ncbi:MAG: pyruvate:ferredoxin (flavodoxin) oxidoreductase, partial [Clostridia bacterium]|nr:pyruvate:ferredoxin (flavodoxin) oxidoreductase [Clostridia bacterium]